MDENNLVQEIYPEQVKSLNPYDISYIAMKNGSILMIIEQTPEKNSSNNYYYYTQSKENKEQNSPNFNIKGKKYISYTKEIKEKNKYDINNYNNYNIEENNILNYSFRSSDEIRNNNNKKYITEKTNPYLIEKRKYIFYKKSNTEKPERNNINPLKHSKTFNYTMVTPVKNKNIINNESFRKKYSNNIYNNISIKNSRYSSKKSKSYINNYQDSFSYGFIKSKSENIIYNNIQPKIEYTDNFTLNKSIEDFNNDIIYNDLRPKTPIYTMRDLGRKNHKKKNGNKNNNLELKKCLSKHNHRYYERKELSAPKKSKSNYIKMKSFNGNTIHVFKNK